AASSDTAVNRLPIGAHPSPNPVTATFRCPRRRRSTQSRLATVTCHYRQGRGPSPLPHVTVRVREGGDGRFAQVDRVPGRRRQHVAPVADDRRVDEVLVEMVGELRRAVL